tara:strand:+ start:1256 stop:1471 length:216 start_codon:yes stop_codon:yes gene_type:complete
MSEGYNEMTDKMKIHYLSTNALEKISTMLKQKDIVIEAQATHIEALQKVLMQLHPNLPNTETLNDPYLEGE